MPDPAPPSQPPRAGLAQISTRWALICDPVQFVMRYAPAIRGYLGVFLKNTYDVDDVCQAFLLRVVERGVVEQTLLRGRFRDYLIATVRHTALAHMRRRPLPTGDGTPLEEVPARDEVVLPGDDEWLAGWRRVVLAGAWDALDRHERDHPGNLAHTALKALVDHPDESSQQLAARVGQLCGRPIQPEAFRKQVSRARRLFAEHLVAEAVRTLEDPTPERVEEELIDIGVMKYVAPFLPADWRTRGTLTDPE